MTGLDLEGFLHLLRADLGVLATVGLIAVGLALLTWTTWGSSRVRAHAPQLSRSRTSAVCPYRRPHTRHGRAPRPAPEKPRPALSPSRRAGPGAAAPSQRAWGDARRATGAPPRATNGRLGTERSTPAAPAGGSEPRSSKGDDLP